MKIACFGSRFYGGQVDRIEKGFVELRHELINNAPENADMLYSNDEGGFKEIIALKEAGKVTGKIIFNVLDIPEHNIKSYNLEGLKASLLRADAVTTISEFVKDQLVRYINVPSSVIYNPIKPIVCVPYPRSGVARFISVGRRHDPNKRFHLGAQALNLLGINYNQLALIGNEHAPWGNFLGVLEDKDLNKIYNYVDFTIALGKVEGLNLPVLEAMAAGIIPIVCNDMTTRKELLPPDLFPEYEDVNPNPIDISKFIARFLNDNDAMEKMKDRLFDHYVNTWENKVGYINVAQAILNVYKDIK